MGSRRTPGNSPHCWEEVAPKCHHFLLSVRQKHGLKQETEVCEFVLCFGGKCKSWVCLSFEQVWDFNFVCVREWVRFVLMIRNTSYRDALQAASLLIKIPEFSEMVIRLEIRSRRSNLLCLICRSYCILLLFERWWNVTEIRRVNLSTHLVCKFIHSTFNPFLFIFFLPLSNPLM